MSQRRVRTAHVVSVPPWLDLGLCSFQAQEAVGNQSFFAKASVERFDLRVVRRLAGAAEMQRYAMFVGPPIERFGDEFWAAVHALILRIR